MSALAQPAVIDLPGYQVHVGPWLLDEAGRIAVATAPAHTFAVITDEQVGPVVAPQVVGSLRHHAPHARVLLRGITPGEAGKTRATWHALTDWLLQERCGRDTTIIALGGGVVGDMAGFVAATFMRGVPFVQVPTSLLAMVDASVGGKVGVDTEHGKNLVGAFHQPAAVVIDPTVLQTLPPDEFRNGMAEVVKHGVITDPIYLARALALGGAILGARAVDVAWSGSELSALVADSVRIKATVVSQDPRETPGGIRQILNFGHTIGHAIEACLDFGIPHGHAVAIGMVVEAGIGESVGSTAPGTAGSIREGLQSLGLPVELPQGLQPTRLLESCLRDKKSRGGRIFMALPARIGVMARSNENGYGVAVPPEAVLTTLLRSGSSQT